MNPVETVKSAIHIAQSCEPSIITFPDNGTMKVNDDVMYFEADGTQRIVTGSCIAVEK